MINKMIDITPAIVILSGEIKINATFLLKKIENDVAFIEIEGQEIRIKAGNTLSVEFPLQLERKLDESSKNKSAKSRKRVL